MLFRLKEIRKALGFTQTDFAKQLGITQTAYSMIENGIRPLSGKYINKICSIFSVSETFLLTGEGEMFLNSPYEDELISIFGRLMWETQDYLLSLARELLHMQQKLLGGQSIS